MWNITKVSNISYTQSLNAEYRKETFLNLHCIFKPEHSNVHLSAYTLIMRTLAQELILRFCYISQIEQSPQEFQFGTKLEP